MFCKEISFGLQRENLWIEIAKALDCKREKPKVCKVQYLLEGVCILSHHKHFAVLDIDAAGQHLADKIAEEVVTRA